MQNRIRIKDLKDHIGETVCICGAVSVRRDHGKLIFIVLSDRSASVQTVIHASAEEAFAQTDPLKEQWQVCMEGLVKERPDNMKKADEVNGDIEFEITSVEVLARAAEMPFDMDAELNLDTLLDYRPLTLRRARDRAIFKVQDVIIKSFRDFLHSQDFTEFQAPKLVGGDAEGGAEVFAVDYFYDKKAYLATSPQLYKQMLVGVFERVFTTGATFRAEKSATTRHLSEIAMLDFEMGFVEDHTEVMAMLEQTLKYIVSEVQTHCAAELALFYGDAPLVPETFPVFTLCEAQELIKKETGEDKTNEPDLDPEDERFLCEYAAKNLGSDFVFVTHFPTSKRPFYTHVDPENPEYTRSFDLLFRGLEMSSGSQRVHDYETLVARIKEKGLDPEKFAFYLQAFKYGLPPHGGIGLGLERLTAKMLGLSNVKEASLFPRDMHRIDTLLSE